MRFSEYTQRLIDLGKTLSSWLAEWAELDRMKRQKSALFAEELAATLSRASRSLAYLQDNPSNLPALLDATRELGRISGYVETILDVLEDHLDGRKRAGVKRRLEYIEPFELETAIGDAGAFRHARRLASAEGYFRALADALRV